ncbi:MAG: methionine synthase [Dehalococcoidia bacterium]|nr:MAG: methionine synthase [Dehalococcoidia bacterium]
MRRSEERILTTHTGSLPRPAELIPPLLERERGAAVDPERFEALVRQAVQECVRQQLANGIDIVSDGEMSKPSYVAYAKDRLTGFGGEGTIGLAADLADFPEYTATLRRHGLATAGAPRPACNGPVRYCGEAELARDIQNFQAALASAGAVEGFLTAAAPGVIAVFLPNQYYPSHEAYIWALAEAMKTEYQTIAAAGIPLQIDCPDLALSKNLQFPDLSLEEFRRVVAMHVEALNWALEGIPPENLRMHVCWGNYEGPHHKDVPLGAIVDLVLQARPRFLSIEAANPRHEHEWTVWQEVPLPEEKVLIPGVIDSTTNFVEHPELVCQRILRFARLVGRERVIAGTDCGFSTGAAGGPVVPSVTWAKLRALREGADRASALLW